MAELVSKRYASALFEAGLELNKIKEFNEELDFIKRILEEEPQLLQILKHPKINKDEKKDLMNKLFKNKTSEEIINFVYVLIDKRRDNHILEIADYYKELFNEHENIMKVTAITAVPMDKNDQEKLSFVLSNKLNKNIELTNEVDNTILGGVLLKVENKLMDGTLKGQLESIGRVIKGASL